MSSRLRLCAVILTSLLGALSVSGKSQAQTYRVTDLGANTFGQAINGAGQVAGYYINGSGANRPFIWTNGILTDLGTLGGTAGQAFGINSSGQVVGQSDLTGSGTRDPLEQRHDHGLGDPGRSNELRLRYQ